MKYCALFLVLILHFSSLDAQKRYYRGNTHAHSYPNSTDLDASYIATDIVPQYKAKGYDFLVFTDHGAWWNASPLTSPDFTVINGSEPGISGNGLWGHFTAVNLKSRISGSGKTHQEMIDAISAQGAIPFINHPRYSQIPISALQIIEKMKNNLFHMEIYNGVTVGQAGPDDISVWDSVLTTGRLMYGVASDDSHKESNQGKGWIMVYSSSNQTDSLVEAIRRGDFYASSGVSLDTISYSSSKIFVKSKNGNSIKFIGKNGSVLKTFEGQEATYTITGEEIYVRAEISNSTGQKAWIQPYMIKKPSGVIYLPEKTGAKTTFLLSQNYPNPFNPSTSISFTLLEPGYSTLKVYSILGKEVQTLLAKNLSPGTYCIDWNSASCSEKLSSGVYIYELVSGKYRDIKRMVLLK
jgi:hypothetical protein